MSMTKEQKQKMRIAVAKDVIASLPLLNVEQGVYCEGNAPEALKAKGSKEVAKALKKNCTVCALGACLLSLVSIDNKYTFKFGEEGEFESSVDYTTPINIDESEDTTNMFNRLRQIFSRPQLCLIESAFEQRTMGAEDLTSAQDTDDMDEWIQLAINFGEQESNDQERLRNIMLNIIANKGQFIPVPSLKAIQYHAHNPHPLIQPHPIPNPGRIRLPLQPASLFRTRAVFPYSPGPPRQLQRPRGQVHVFHLQRFSG